jgi:hypothetical protein
LEVEVRYRTGPGRRRTMSVSPCTPDANLIWSVVRNLPDDTDPNQDFLFDLSNGMKIEELAERYASGNEAKVRSRIAIQYGKLGIPYPYTSPEGMHILKCAFELFDQRASK